MTPPAVAASPLAETARAREEWRPWLVVLEAVREAASDRGWADGVPPQPGERAPLLDGVTLTADARRLHGWLRTLLERAAGAGGPAASLAEAAAGDRDDLVALFEAALVQDAARVEALAASLGAEAGALAAVAAVAPVPLLRAAATRWSPRIPADWQAGHCPVCGAWPILAEARGLERTRRLRCGRCAADWPTPWMTCPFCGSDDHARLGSLAPEASRETRKVDTCGACRGYLKTLTVLAPTPADDLALVDLATVELDLAAIEAGYARPQYPACTVDVRLRVRERRGWGLLGRRGRRP